MRIERSSPGRICWPLLLILLGLSPTLATAASITVTPSTTTAVVGDEVDFTFALSGFTVSPGDSLAAFDIDVLFQPALFEFVDAQFGPPNPLEFPEIGAFPFFGSAAPAGTTVDAFAVSGNSQTAIDAQQANAFTFLTLRFRAQAPGLATIGIDPSDPFLSFISSDNQLLSLPGGQFDASVSITGTPTSVPEPTSLLMLGTGLAYAVRRRIAARNLR